MSFLIFKYLKLKRNFFLNFSIAQLKTNFANFGGREIKYKKNYIFGFSVWRVFFKVKGRFLEV